jgi:hypothetical protein
MRLRFAVLASVLTALSAVALPSVVSAAPKHNDGLTINAAPRQVIAGEGVLIYGQLVGSDVAGQTVRLYHRVALAPRYTLIGTTTTDSHGFYEFTRAEGVVTTNRSWFVRGPDGSHSRTIHEVVSALVSLTPSTTSTDTRHPVVFTGHVYPDHAFERIALQVQSGTSDNWHTIRSGFTNGASNYRIAYRWAVPNTRNVRAVFVGDRRDVRSSSDPVTVTVQQAQVDGFTINTAEPVIDYLGSTSISGVLSQPGSPGTPDAGVVVTLLARTARTGRYQAVATETTGSDGGYSFANLPPAHNTEYVVRTTLAPKRHSAYLFEGVRDAVTAAPSSTSSSVGSTITFSGQILPGKDPGDVVYLQRLGKDGDWHTVKLGFVNALSAFSIPWTLGNAGTDTFRIRVLGDRANIGGVSSPMSVTVAPAPSPAALPPAT